MNRLSVRYTVSVALIMATLTIQAQNIPAFYADLEAKHESGAFNDCLAFESQVEQYAQSHKDSIANNSFYYIADSHYQLGDIEKCITWYEKEKDFLKGSPLEEEYSTLLYNLSFIYMEAGTYEKARANAADQLAIDKKLFGETSDEYNSTVLAVCDVYYNTDHHTDAISLLQATLKKQEKGSLNYGLLQNKLGDLYTYTGEYTKASRTLNDALSIFKKELEPEAIQTASAGVNVGILHLEQGKYPEAETDFESALKSIPQDDPAYLPTLNNLALVQQRLGQFETSERTFKTIQEAELKRVGASHPDYAITLSNLSMVYFDQNKFSDAEKVLLEALEIQRKSGENKSVSYAKIINNLAKVYVFSGAPEKAIPLYEEAQVIFKEAFGEESADFGTVTYNQGVAYWKANKGDQAITYLRKSANLRAKVLGKRHPKYTESRQKIAEYQWEKKQKKDARLGFNEVFENYYAQIDATFPVLTEEEKAKFYYNTIKPAFDKYNSFAVEYYKEDPTVAGEIFNHQINSKGVVILATEKVKQAILSSNNNDLINKFESWQSTKEMIAKLYSHNGSPARLDSLRLVVDEMEKDLTRESASFAKTFTKKQNTWQGIQKMLKPGEAAIEVLRFNNYIPALGGKFTEQVTYGFVIVTPSTKTNPHLVLLNDGQAIEGRYLKFHRNAIQLGLEDVNSYGKYFEPLGDYLRKNKINRFYFSPDGVFNQINLNTIWNTTTKKYLIDEFSIVQMTNTRELLDSPVASVANNSAVLMGFAKFNLEEGTSTGKSNSQVRGLPPDAGTTRSLRGGLLRLVDSGNSIAVLPGTQKEVNEINSLFGSKATIFTEIEASEGKTKSIKAPNILHIATHGYFMPDDRAPLEGSNQYVFNPLLKSGLILAGAESFLRTGNPVDSGGEDGILTAYEAMNLNLDDTRLLVLSACETGLGEIKNGEGVYGLQRAFKLSGADCIVMSLWSVDDEATQQLMILFYQEYLKNNNPYEALRAAQKKLMVKFPKPFYWGAFVVVG